MANIFKKALKRFTFVKQPKVPMQVVRNIYRQLYPYINNAVWMDDKLESYVQQGYLRNANLYAVINYIATQGSKVPWCEYEVVDEKAFRRYMNYKGAHRSENFVTAMKLQKKALREVEGGQLTKLLAKPNKYQTQALLMQNWIGFRRLCGNAYLWKNKLQAGVNKGRVTELIFLPPQYTEIVWNHQAHEISGYKLMYGENRIIPADEVLHSKYWNPDFTQDGNNLYGLSPQQAGSRVITKNNDAYEFEAKMVQNSGPPGLLVTENDIGEQAIKKFYRQWDRRFRNNKSENVNTPLILSELGKVDWKQTGMTPADAMIMESKKMDLRDICNLHSINSAIFNDPDNKTYNNMREAKKAAWHDAILCDLDAIKDDINKEIAPAFGDNIVVDYDLQAIPDLQDNVKEQVDWLERAWWIKGNEKRIVMGYDEDPDLDWYPIPFGIQQGVMEPAETLSDEELGKMLVGVNDYGNGRH